SEFHRVDKGFSHGLDQFALAQIGRRRNRGRPITLGFQPFSSYIRYTKRGPAPRREFLDSVEKSFGTSAQNTLTQIGVGHICLYLKMSVCYLQDRFDLGGHNQTSFVKISVEWL